MLNWFKKKKTDVKESDAEESSKKEESASHPSSSADRELEIISCDVKSKSESHVPDDQIPEPQPSSDKTADTVDETCSEILETVSESNITEPKYSIETLAEIHQSDAHLKKEDEEEGPESILASKSEGQARYEPTKSVTFEDEEETGG